MSLIADVIQELFGMFWADAGLCLGALGVVLGVGLGRRLGWVDGPWALAALVAGIVLTLLLNVWAASSRRR
nr:hypothetical protein [uncultured Roseateles sp.]